MILLISSIILLVTLDIVLILLLFFYIDNTTSKVKGIIFLLSYPLPLNIFHLIFFSTILSQTFL